MDIVANFDALKLGTESTLENLLLWDIEIDIESTGDNLTRLFEQQPLMPGIILTNNYSYVGMISRRRFFEYMSRPHSLGLFSGRAIKYLYNALQPEDFILSENTPITQATEMALQRLPELVYEPIVIKLKSGIHKILDFQQLLLAHSEIYGLTLAELQKAQEQTKIAETNLQNLKSNYSQLIENEKMNALSKFVAVFTEEINRPVNLLAGNIIHLNRYVQELLKLIQLYEKKSSQVAINNIQPEFLSSEINKLLTVIKGNTKHIQETVRSLRQISSD